jgi:hypothetical protein
VSHLKVQADPYDTEKVFKYIEKKTRTGYEARDLVPVSDIVQQLNASLPMQGNLYRAVLNRLSKHLNQENVPLDVCNQYR